MAKASTLVTLPNKQYDSIEIPDYTVLELYTESVSDANYVGYYIVPIGGLSDTEIETKLKTLAGTKEGYANFALLVSRDGKTKEYNRKRVYGVYYKTTAPTYPEETKDVTTYTPAPQYDVYQTITVTNPGVAAPCKLTLTVDSIDDPVELYVNNNYIACKPNEIGELVIDDVARMNGAFVEDYDAFDRPTLVQGENTIKVKATNVTNVSVTYTPFY